MKNTIKRKKGASLIEVIISITVFAILIIPITNIVINSIKTNKLGEKKQAATFEGQKILEEFKAYDTILLDASNKFLLLNNAEITQSGNSYTGDFIVNRADGNLDANVTMTKDANFISAAKVNEGALVLNFKENGKLDIEYTKVISGGTEIVKVERTYTRNNFIFRVINGNRAVLRYDNNIVPIFNSSEISELLNKKILINVSSACTDPINFEIINSLTDINGVQNKIFVESTVYRPISGAVVDIKDISGKVSLSQRRYDAESTKVGDMYNIIVEVKNNDGNILFTGSSTQNILIK